MKKILFSIYSMLMVSVTMAQSADEIINRYYDVTGGRAKWTQIKSVRYSGKYEFGQGIEAPFSLLLGKSSGQDCLRGEFSFQGLTAIQVITGDSGWAIMPFQGNKTAEPLPADAIRSMKTSMDIQGPLFDYAAKGHKVEYIGKDDLEGSETYKIKCILNSGDVVYYYFDSESGLLLKESQITKLKDKEVTADNIYAEYTKVDFGITIPFQTETKGDAGSQISRVNAVTVNPEINAADFIKPKN